MTRIVEDVIVEAVRRIFPGKHPKPTIAVRWAMGDPDIRVCEHDRYERHHVIFNVWCPGPVPPNDES